MNKQQSSTSPKTYIQTRARHLPIDACYVNPDWEIARLASVIVLRRHSNGNFTGALYLVDLLCRGVKDSFYFFNLSQKELEEKFDISDDARWIPINYNLAHNIIFAGHDFAMDYEIEPHDSFAVSRYILEEDNDAIPLIDIPTGDNNGNPHLTASASENYGSMLGKLKKFAGEGNYTFTIATGAGMADSFYREDDDFSDISEDLDDISEDDLKAERTFLTGVHSGHLDFHYISHLSTLVLLELLSKKSRTPSEELVIQTELQMRLYERETNEKVIYDDDTTAATAEYIAFEEGEELWKVAYNRYKKLIDKVLPKLNRLLKRRQKLKKKDSEITSSDINELLIRFEHSELAMVALLQPLPVDLMVMAIDELDKRYDKQLPLTQLQIIIIHLLFGKETRFHHQAVLQATTITEAYPSATEINSLHHRFFWVLKALQAINNDNKEEVWRWHNLLRLEGIGGNLKFLYAGRLKDWLDALLGMEEEEIAAD